MKAQTSEILSDADGVLNRIEKKKRMILVLAITALLLLLIVFKYTSFILENMFAIVGLFGVEVSAPVWKLILPVGLSFYLFQSMGYMIDVYRGVCSAEKNFFKHALFISFFPQLLQGPIGSYEMLAPQLFAPHEFDYTQSVGGAQRIAWGFFKKLVIANQIEGVIGVAFVNYMNYSGIIWLIFLFMYAIELYADFSGYMDIVNGSAQMLGITLAENFDTPYFSTSVAEFWRRWHISLGAWFRNYLFYPLLRSERMNSLRIRLKRAGASKLSSIIPTVLALAMVWLCTGAWHGAAWSYIFYGIYYGVFICLDVVMKQPYSKWRKKHMRICKSRIFKCFQIMRTFLIVVVGYGIFRPVSLKTTGYIYSHIWMPGNSLQRLYGMLVQNKITPFALIIGITILFLIDLYHLDKSRESIRIRISKACPVVRYIIYLAGFFMIALFGTFGQSAFIYFDF